MEDRIKRIHDIAIENLKQDGHIAPVLLIEGEKDNAIVGLELKDKYREMRFAGEKVAHLSPTAVTFVSEAWMARKFPPEGMEVHDMLDKLECVSIVTQKANGESYACFIPFSRLGKEIILGETEWMPDGGVVDANILKLFWLGVRKVRFYIDYEKG